MVKGGEEYTSPSWNMYVGIRPLKYRKVGPLTLYMGREKGANVCRVMMQNGLKFKCVSSLWTNEVIEMTSQKVDAEMQPN